MIYRLTQLKICGLAALVFVFIFPLALVYSQGEFVYDSKGRRDPFIPLVTPQGRLLQLEAKDDTNVLTVEGIIYDKYDLSYAIVNGEVFKVGDKVGDFLVLKIKKNKVIFIKDGQPLEIELKEMIR